MNIEKETYAKERLEVAAIDLVNEYKIAQMSGYSDYEQSLLLAYNAGQFEAILRILEEARA